MALGKGGGGWVARLLRWLASGAVRNSLGGVELWLRIALGAIALGVVSFAAHPDLSIPKII